MTRRLSLRKLERRELVWLIVGFAVCLLLWGFISLAGEVMEGDTQAFDTRILQTLRDPVDLARPRGPSWLEPALLDLTAIGGPTVLGLVVISVVGYLLLQARYRTALVILITAASGEVANNILKNFFER